MSDYVRNKGKLVPVEDIQTVIKGLYQKADVPDYYKDMDDWFADNYYEYEYEFIDGKWFKVEYEIEGKFDSDPTVVEVTHNDDGTTSFHTYHYNGGAHWTELLEGKV